jgi:Fe-S-cluster containining protein
MPDAPNNPREAMLPDVDGHTTVPVTLTILGARVNGAARVPSANVSVKEMLPAFRVVADAVVRLTERSLSQHGQKLSCTKGCGACCRQAVPVSPSEAARLREVIEQMDEPRRTRVKQAFADAEERARHAGVYDRLVEPERFSAEELKGAPLEYFRLNIACPFLEDESCSIYDERPLVCREYLVTSPAAYCSNPDERVAAVRMPLKSSEALARIDDERNGRYVRRIPMTLAVGMKSTPAEATHRTGPALLSEFLGHLERTREDI